MADKDFRGDGVPEITRYEHDRKNVGTKKVDLWGYLPGSDEKVRITAIDNGDGTYSLKTGGASPGVAAYSDASGVDKKGLVNANRQVQVDVITSALPTGAATSANQQTNGLTDTQLRATAVPISLAVAPTTPVTGTFFQGTQPVSNASLPLPALASTSTKQSDGSQKGQIVDSTGNVVTVTGNRLDVNATISTAGLATSAIQTTQQTSLNIVTTDLDYRFSGGKISYAAVLSTSGDQAVITPTAGKRIQIYWIAFVPNSDNTISNLVTAKFVTSAINMYIGYAMAHWELFTGAINEAVTINLTNTQPVAFTIHYKEIA